MMNQFVSNFKMTIVVFLFSPLFSFAQVNADQSTPISIFEEIHHSEIIEATLTTDLDQLEANVRTEIEQPATFTFIDRNGESISVKTKIRPRGKFRRRVCSFPPIKMKFSKKQLAENGYTPFRSVKLVTHCLDEKFVGKENVVKEYLTYKMYNELSDKSYRTQLLKITYINSNNPKDKMRRYAFIIESTKEMAARLGGEECECLNPDQELVSAKDENLMALFQYMIGNEDWSLSKLRNTKLVKPHDGSPLIPVPYDFDFAGVVDAPYALPAVDYQLKSVQDRYMLGWEADPRQQKVNLNLLKTKRKRLEEIINEFKILTRTGRDQMLAYLASFYDELDNGTAMNGTAMK